MAYPESMDFNDRFSEWLTARARPFELTTRPGVILAPTSAGIQARCLAAMVLGATILDPRPLAEDDGNVVLSTLASQ